MRKSRSRAAISAGGAVDREAGAAPRSCPTDPDTVALYRLLSEALDWPVDHPRIVEIVDVLERRLLRAAGTDEFRADYSDDTFVALLDETTVRSSPVAERVLALLHEPGWRG